MKNTVELREKIFEGIKSSIEKLIASRAKNNEFLIVSKDGKIVKIPAKELKQN
ncbi:MAG: hypothetical protein ABI638_15315 [Ignavibacteriota bacterium]